METEVAEVQEGQENGSVLEVKATKTIKNEDGTKTPLEATIDWDPGADLEEAADMYGAETVFDLYKRAAVIKLQAQMRGRLEQGASQEEIEAEFTDWRPDVDRTRERDPKAVILQAFNKLSDEEREALFARLRG